MGAKAAKVTRKPTAHLERFLKSFDSVLNAKMTFTVYQRCNFLRYVLRQDTCGLVVVNVETVSEPVEGDWSKTAKIRRVMSTEHALEQCFSLKSQGIHLGKQDLLRFQATLASYQNDHRQWTVGYEVYHESDVLEDIDIRELIGVVRWYPFRSTEAPDPKYFQAPYEYPTADLIYIGEPFRQSIRRARK
jgi:hypothetical protein